MTQNETCKMKLGAKRDNSQLHGCVFYFKYIIWDICIQYNKLFWLNYMDNNKIINILELYNTVVRIGIIIWNQWIKELPY